MIYDYIVAIFLFIGSFLIVYISTLLWIRFAQKRGITAPDAHKKDKPLVANLGGIPFIISLLVFFIAGIFTDFTFTIVIVSSTLIGFIIGLADDFYDLGLKKMILVVLAAIPVLIFKTYVPRPLFPLIGGTRMFILYPFIIIATYLVVVNACNMVDTHNGILATQVIFVIAAMMIYSILFNEFKNVIFLATALGAVLGFFVLNKYPAKVFWGNCGAHAVGALLATLVIITRKEYIALIALLPTILQGFTVIMSIGGFMTRLMIRERKGNESFVLNGIIYPSLRNDAPLSIPRLLCLINGPIDEKSLVKKYTLLFALSFVLSLITGYFIYFIRL